MTSCHTMTFCPILYDIMTHINKLTLMRIRNIIRIHNDNNNVNS